MNRWAQRGAWLAAALGFVAHPAVAAEASYLVSARTEVRTRTAQPGDTSAAVSGDLELLPSALAALRSSTTLLSLQYHPSILLREPYALGPVTLLHRGRLLFTRRWERSSLTLLQEGSAGMLDVGALRPLDGALPGDAPVGQTVGLVPYVRSGSWLTWDTRPSDRVSLSFTAAYLISGSTELSYAVPLQRGPLATARFRWTASRIDWLTTTAQAMAAWFVTGQEQLIASLAETWERRLSETVTASVGGGVAVAREVIVALPILDPPIPGLYVEVLPVATAGVTWQQLVRDAPVRLQGTVRMAPFADRFTGFVYERLEARVSGEWRPERVLTVTGATGAAYAVPMGTSEQLGDRLVFLEAGVTWEAREWLLLGFNAQAMWVEQPQYGTPGQLQALGVLSAMVQDRGSATW